MSNLQKWLIGYKLIDEIIPICVIVWKPPTIFDKSMKELTIKVQNSKLNIYMNDVNITENVGYEFPDDCLTLFLLIVSIFKNETIIRNSLYYKFLPITWKKCLDRIFYIDDILLYKDTMNEYDCKFVIEEMCHSHL
jgi:hypothetical protein